MPLYTVTCACGITKDVILASWKSENPRCPCGCVTVRKPSAPAVQFKGSGFYATDYKVSHANSHNVSDV